LPAAITRDNHDPSAAVNHYPDRRSSSSRLPRYMMILAWNLGVAALLVALEGALGRRVLSRLEQGSAPV